MLKILIGYLIFCLILTVYFHYKLFKNSREYREASIKKPLLSNVVTLGFMVIPIVNIAMAVGVNYAKDDERNDELSSEEKEVNDAYTNDMSLGVTSFNDGYVFRIANVEYKMSNDEAVKLADDILKDHFKNKVNEKMEEKENV